MVSTNIPCIIQWLKQTNLCNYQCKIFITKKILLSICASAEQYDRCWDVNVPRNKDCSFFPLGEFSAFISSFHPSSCFDCKFLSIVIVTVQLLSHVWVFAILWTEAHQASLSFTISWSLFKFMSVESVMLSSHLLLCCPLLLCLQSFPASGSFPISGLFTSDVQSIGASASASVLPMNIQGWFSLELTGLISL